MMLTPAMASRIALWPIERFKPYEHNPRTHDEVREAIATEMDAQICAPSDDELPEAPKRVTSRPGDLWRLGRHRLICADAADVAAIEHLMAGERAALLFTSPPYANQRDYTAGGIADWDALMQGVFTAAFRALREDGQILVNLGLVHRNGEWQPYWEAWIAWMRAQGWRRFGWYVWDQVVTLPGDWSGRLAPRHEFIFHFNRSPDEKAQQDRTVSVGWAGYPLAIRWHPCWRFAKQKRRGLRLEPRGFARSGLPHSRLGDCDRAPTRADRPLWLDRPPGCLSDSAAEVCDGGLQH
jgi:hypothetical protein